jgi:hypothetical protein
MSGSADCCSVSLLRAETAADDERAFQNLLLPPRMRLQNRGLQIDESHPQDRRSI